MNSLYVILESRYHWLILAGTSFTVGTVGAIAMLAYAWPHTLALIWFYAGSVITLFFLARALADWKASVEAALRTEGERGDRE